MIDLAIQIDKITLAEGGKVKRRWIARDDGSLVWRKRANVVWEIEHHNVGFKPKLANRPMIADDDRVFRPHEHSVTLDDFVLLRDIWRYCHIKTGMTFTARQINRHIFRDKSSWPVRRGYGDRMNPAAWIRKYNRVEESRRFAVVRGALHAQP